MAEAYLNHFGKHRYQAYSAGIEAGKLNPVVVKVMQEERINISGNEAKTVDQFLKSVKDFEYVITVCDEASAERCPVIPGAKRKLHWSFDDPSTFSGSEEDRLNRTRMVRDQIKSRVVEFIDRGE